MSKDVKNVQAQDDSLARIRELTEQELLAVAGGAKGDTHVHMSCCHDCPTREGN